MLKYALMIAGVGILCLTLLGGSRYYQRRFEKEALFQIRHYIAYALLLGAAPFLFWDYGYGVLKILKLLILMSMLIVIGKIDKQERIIPNMLLLILIICRFLLLVGELLSYPQQGFVILLSIFLGMVYGSVIFLVAKLMVPKSIGMGDVKLFGVIGAYLGSSGIFQAMVVSLFIAMIYGLIMIVRKKLTMKDSLTFGPYIAIGTILVLILGV